LSEDGARCAAARTSIALTFDLFLVLTSTTLTSRRTGVWGVSELGTTVDVFDFLTWLALLTRTTTGHLWLTLVSPTRILFEGKAAYEGGRSELWREGRRRVARGEGFLAWSVDCALPTPLFSAFFSTTSLAVSSFLLSPSTLDCNLIGLVQLLHRLLLGVTIY
jgi:hypothetical protein